MIDTLNQELQKRILCYICFLTILKMCRIVLSVPIVAVNPKGTGCPCKVSTALSWLTGNNSPWLIFSLRIMCMQHVEELCSEFVGYAVHGYAERTC